jgi:Transposase DDE domain
VILTLLALRAIFSLALRQAEELVGSIIGLHGLALAARDHSTLTRREKTLEVPRPRLGGGANSRSARLLADRTGLKLGGGGERLVERQSTKTRRRWRMLNIGMDAGAGEIVTTELTTNDIDDASQVGRLLDQIRASVSSFSGHGTYDQDNIYRALVDRDSDAAVIAPPLATAVLS